MGEANKEGRPRIVIVCPYLNEPETDVVKVKRILEKRAGMPVQVHMIKDKNRIGPFALHNKAFKTLDFDYYVYTCMDTFPGREYIRIAYETISKNDMGVLAFNSGKWFGRNAAVGMVSKKYINEFQNGILFYPKYRHHGADPELSERAMRVNKFIYEPRAILIEVDYEKDFGVKRHPADSALFMKRRQERFPNDYTKELYNSI